ncbi:hypothetical protein [Streptomyces xiamenensis]|uniref:hypothetical protein n=1 Tax=Streptomyces xiamenensis TaxID=408015 RepID=UPI0035DFF3AA
MPHTAEPYGNANTTVAPPPAQLPFLLTPRQGEAARTLLQYVVSLALPGPDAQLLAVVVAIRAARGGVGNVTGQDLSSLRLADARGAVEALRRLGWQVDGALLVGDPSAPVPVTVPDLAQAASGHPLLFAEKARSRVSGWVSRTLSVKPVRKLPPAARLAGLFIAAHSTSTLLAPIPPDLPRDCRDALPDLAGKGFLAELSGGRCRLAPVVGHLSGRRPSTAQEQALVPEPEEQAPPAPPSNSRFRFCPDEWAQWKTTVTSALRGHAEAVEFCAVCSLPPERVAEAFMTEPSTLAASPKVRWAYGRWKEKEPDRGPVAAELTVTFRAEHGHGPSHAQLCAALGWNLRHALRGYVVQRLLETGWLTDTSPVPWTLRPGRTAQAQGIALPGARASTTAPAQR